MGKLAILALLCTSAVAQYSPSGGGAVAAGAPPGGIGAACTSTTQAYLDTTGVLVTCINGLWTAVSTTGPAGPAGPVGPAGPNGSDGAPGVPGYSPNSIISGGQVAWTGGLNFTASATVYQIGGTQYTAPQTNLTLTAADGSHPRIDAIVVNTSSAVAVITGTPATTPAPPAIDPSTQLGLTFVLVPTGGTAPTGTASTLVYDENAGPSTEWTCAKSGTPIALASTNNPYHLTKDIEATAAVNGNYAQCAAAAPFSLTTTNYLVLYLRSKATWPSKKSIQIQSYLSTAAVGSIVSISEGSFGFTTANTSSYQQIVIPVTLFGQIASMDTLRFTVQGGASSIGFYLDWITLQSGLPSPNAPTAMTFRGAWNATATYAVNDVVISGSVSYVALASSTNVVVSTTATWSALSSPLVVKTSDTGTVSNTMLANSSVTVGGTPCTLGSSCVPGATAGGFLVGQSQAMNSISSVTVTATYAPTTGNTVIVFCPYMAFGATQPSSITVTDGTNTYTQDSNYFSTTDIGGGGDRHPAFSIHRSSNVTGGSYTFTCTIAPGGYNAVMGIYVTEWTGIKTSSPLDGTANATITSAVGIADSGAITTTNATDLLLGIYVLPSGNTFTGCLPGSGFDFLTGDNATGNAPSGIFARNVSTIASRHATCVYTGVTSKAVAGQIAYKLQ